MQAAERAEAEAGFERALGDLRAKFAEELEYHILSLEAAQQALAAGDGREAEALAAIERLTHRHAGLAPTLGFRTMGALARQAEKAAATAAAASGGSQAETCNRVMGLVEVLLDEMERQLDEGASGA